MGRGPFGEFAKCGFSLTDVPFGVMTEWIVVDFILHPLMQYLDYGAPQLVCGIGGGIFRVIYCNPSFCGASPDKPKVISSNVTEPYKEVVCEDVFIACPSIDPGILIGLCTEN
jgi:hypothetical protein